MDNVLQTTTGTEDTYRLFVPIEDTDLIKSVTMDENGDYIVQGVMTSDATDEEGDSISPTGMDCSYFLEKGWIKYEHGNSPEQFIGEPVAVQVGRFTHPTTQKSVNGIFVKGRLFAQRAMTQRAVEALTEIQKSNTKRRMGWSIEGNTQKRDAAGKIVKSIIRNVVLTMNPINTTTWAELAKSFAKDHELTIALGEPLDKAMDIAATQEIRQQSVEGVKDRYRSRRGDGQNKDDQSKWIHAFRKFVKRGMMHKAHRDLLIKSAQFAADSAYFFARDEAEFTDDEAESFALYIAEKHDILKSLGQHIGGASMSGEAKQVLATILDEDLEELQKSLSLEDEGEDDEDLIKSYNDEEDDEEDTEDEESEEEDDEDDEDEDVQKSFDFGANGFSKSFSEDPENAQALEVSDFLTNLVDEVGVYMGGFEKSMQTQRKQTLAVVNAVTNMGELIKSLVTEMQEVKAENQELQKSLNNVMNTPIGRRSVVSNREAQTLQKSMETQSNAVITKAAVADMLMKSFEAGDLSGSEIARFEAGVPVHQLQLPAALRTNLGL